MHKRAKTVLIAILVLAAIVFALSRTGVGTFVTNWYQVVHVKLFPPSFPDTPEPTDPDDIALMQAGEDAAANVFGDLPEVLAALPMKMRLQVFAYYKDPSARLLIARSWAMTKKDMTGDPGEIEPFLKLLETPVDISQNDDDLNGSTDKGTSRRDSLYALMKALESNSGYNDEYNRMQEVALSHLGYRTYSEAAATVLELLDERGALDKEAKAALDKAIEHQLLQRVFYKHLKMFKDFFAKGSPG